MERVSARACLTVGALAAATAALAVGATSPSAAMAAHDPRTVVVRVAGPTVAPASEGHGDAGPSPSPEPSGPPAMDETGGGHMIEIPSGQPTAMPPDHGGGTEMGEHGEPSPGASGDPLGGGTPAGAESLPTETPGGHDAMGGATPMPEDGHGAAGTGDTHADAGGEQGHGDDSPTAEEKPRTAVLGGFAAINVLVLAAAAVTRRRDRAKAAAKTAITSADRKDASR